MARPLLSVVIPACNGAGFLAEAVESIRRQDYQPLEIIVVDDGSTDDTARLVGGLGCEVRYIYQAHSGRPAAGRNRGIKESVGEIVGFLDQDDLWPADKLAVQMPCLLEDASLDVILGHTQILHLGDTVDGKREFQAHERVDYLMLSSALFKRRVFDKVGAFDETLVYFGDDLDWFIRAREMGVSIRRLEDVTLFWRIHEANASHHPSIRNHSLGYDRALTEVIRKSLHRRR